MRINVTRSSLPPFEEYMDELRDIWDTHWLTNNGEKLKRLEAALKAYWGMPCVSLFSNGHLALEALLATMELKGEVITTPYTFASTTHALVRRGLKPVFADIRAEDFTLDPQKIEALITPDTCAILPVHVYGHLCQVDEIDRIAKKHRLKVVYDAAHSFGTTLGGQSSAAFGDAAMFSFHATKVFNTIEGGAIVTRDEALCDRLALERNFGIADEESVPAVGGNAKMNEFQAAMGLCNLPLVKSDIEKRRHVYERYMSHLQGVKGLTFAQTPEGEQYNYAYLPVVFGGRFDRNELYSRLAAADIHARKYFYPLISDFECYRGRFDTAQTPVAARVSQGVLTLPMYPELSDEDVDRVCAVILA